LLRTPHNVTTSKHSVNSSNTKSNTKRQIIWKGKS
jgi:hypothetical protein